ncbi:MAG: repressor LexA [Proteobacteria bacterium]|nr:MAG: repressor LexA [Pseudomonadota bacterium]
MDKLTKRQSEVLALVKNHLNETGYPPTRAEIARELGFRSANAAEEHLKALSRKGAIEMIPGASRGIRIISQDNDEPKGIPIVGKVAAGNPVLAIENIDEYCEVPAGMFTPPAHYFLRVSGFSMKDAGILDGDLLAVHRTNQVRNGQIVVARLEDEVTVKRWQKDGNKVRLLPENESFDPIVVDLKQQQLEIEGLGVGIIRR